MISMLPVIPFVELRIAKIIVENKIKNNEHICSPTEINKVIDSLL